MAITYFVYINKEDKENDCCKKADFTTTRKADYTKFAKQALKDGAKSVDVYANVKDQCSGHYFPTYVKTFYPEDFKIKKEQAMKKKVIEHIDFFKYEAEIKLQDGEVICYEWDAHCDVEEEDIVEWMTEQNISPESIEMFAYIFPRRFNLELLEEDNQ